MASSLLAVETKKIKFYDRQKPTAKNYAELKPPRQQMPERKKQTNKNA